MSSARLRQADQSRSCTVHTLHFWFCAILLSGACASHAAAAGVTKHKEDSINDASAPPAAPSPTAEAHATRKAEVSFAASRQKAEASLPTSRSLGCGTNRECSGHGHCQRGADGEACKCSNGYFGHDCSRKQRDCAQLRSCRDCQDAANVKFCGWCADARYCVPKHVHRGLEKRGKACSKWYEDTCPARPLNHSAASWVSDEMGDDTSVQLAEALVALIDGAAGNGSAQWVFFFLLLACCAGVLRCGMREHQAAVKQKRFEAYMAEETETGRTPFSVPRACRQLGPWAGAPAASSAGPQSWVGDAKALADALGTGTDRFVTPPTASRRGGARGSTPGAAADEHGGESSLNRSAEGADVDRAAQAEAAEAAAARAMEAAAAEAAALEASIRAAARKDLEERKELRRQQAEAARIKAEQAQVEAAEEGVRRQLIEQARRVRSAARVAGDATPDAAPGAVPGAARAAAAMSMAATAEPEASPLGRQQPAAETSDSAAHTTASAGGSERHELGRHGAAGESVDVFAPAASQAASGHLQSRAAVTPQCDAQTPTSSTSIRAELGGGERAHRAGAGSTTSPPKAPPSSVSKAEAEFLAALDDL